MKAFLQPLKDLAGYEDLRRQIRTNRGVIQVSGCIESQKVHLAAGLSEESRVTLLVAENELKARELYGKACSKGASSKEKDAAMQEYLEFTRKR